MYIIKHAVQAMSMLIFKQGKIIMVARGRGGGKTPERVVKLIRDAVAESSQAKVALATGQTRLTIQRYMQGIGEPSQATLEKLARYFKVSVFYLRGQRSIVRDQVFNGGHDEAVNTEKRVDDLMRLLAITPDDLKESLILAIHLVRDEIEDLLLQFVSGVEVENEKILNRCIDKLDTILYYPGR